jgi:uncharacterized protein YlxW (UPF0749 family)
MSEEPWKDLPSWPDRPDYRLSSLFRWRGRASMLGAAMFALLGLLLVAGTTSQNQQTALATARPGDLVAILDDLQAQNERLVAEQQQLTAELAALESGSEAQALAQAQQRLASLRVLAGSAPEHGPGIKITIEDPDAALAASDMLDMVAELRNAGATSIQFAESRVVADTWFKDAATLGRVLVSGQETHAPYTVLAIGDPETLATALRIPGGVVDSVRTAGGRISLQQLDDLEVTATVEPGRPQYAQPAKP